MSEHMLIFGDALDVLRTLDAESVDMCATSPPYYSLRDYGHADQIGLEATPEAYVQRLVEVFAEVRRVLKPGGTCWVNLGDSFAGSANNKPHTGKAGVQGSNGQCLTHNTSIPAGLKLKDLCGIPWRVAFALQADGWWLRRDIIWAKGVSGDACAHGWHGSCMPESVDDRPTASHEYIFLLAKSPRYWYDYYAAREDGACPAGTKAAKGSEERAAQEGVNARPAEYAEYDGKRNRRSVWTCSPKGFSGAHFAVWPAALVEPMIVAGCPPKVCANPECGEPWEHRVEREGSYREGQGRSDGKRDESEGGLMRNDAECWSGRVGDGREARDLGYFPACACNAPALPGTVLDPFCGSGTTTQVARKLGRRSIGIELNPEYEAVMRERLDLPTEGSLFSDEDLGVEFVSATEAVEVSC